MKCVRSALTMAACLVLGTSLNAGDKFTVADTKGQHLDLVTPAGQPILRYVYARDTSTPERTFDTGKVFAHVFASDGETTITKGPGGKFPHHRGIFIGWSKIQHGGKRHDLWHVKNTSQEHRKFLKTEGAETGATVTSVISWIGTEGTAIAEEARTYHVVAQEDVHAVIDFSSEVKAVSGDIELNGDPEHAGIQFRPSQQVAENKSAKYVFHEEGIQPQKNPDLPWVAAMFEVDGQTWTVQHMSHPSNPKGARWSAYRDYGRFGPFTVVKIADGSSQVFRYRFRVISGEAPPVRQLAEAYEAYAR